MFTKKKILICILVSITLPYSGVFAAECAIENGPSPGIVSYVAEVKKDISNITNGARANCGPKKAGNGIISGTNRVTEVLDG